MNKVVTSEQAIGSIQSGMTVGVGGWGPRRKPMALIRELLRSEVKDLTVIAYGGADVGMLCAAGKIKKLIFAFVSLDFIPLEPYFRIARQSGDIEVMEIDEGMMLLGLRAAAMGVPFIPTEVGLGTDVITRNESLKLVQSPYDASRDWVAMPALDMDIALLHVDKADARGVCQIAGPDHYMDDCFARAAKQTIVSCDQLVDTDYFNADPTVARTVFWERSCTNQVVEIPHGAHPSSCNPLYGFDAAHFKTYAASAKEEDGWQNYFAQYVDVSHSDYIERVGGADAINQLPMPVY